MKRYYYSLVRRYLSTLILADNSVVEIDPKSNLLISSFSQLKVIFLNKNDDNSVLRKKFGNDSVVNFEECIKHPADYYIVGGLLHYERDIQKLLGILHKMCNKQTRVIFIYYSSAWRLLVRLATKLGLRENSPELNWLAHEDIINFLRLENFELIKRESKVLIPFYIPIISELFNRFFAPLPFFNNFCLVNIAIAKPIIADSNKNTENLNLSVSIIVPARNESGNINEIINRIPAMGPEDEIIFVEGNSQDDTWTAIKQAKARYGDKRNILICQQSGKGKGDAVRKGFELASKEILMILDADMTVPPEDLPRFYRAIKDGKGEFINGTRLVYPMEKRAMRYLNLVANKFFAMAFSFVLGQRFKDTLCGTKVITRSNYLRLAMGRQFFGEFDPFGDFDLIFGAARMGLKIVEVPIVYCERVYGVTNISRWRHGIILLAMLIFSAKKIKFI